ncbi:hypothetical protein PFISCL1PPCAC_25575, partial [Pristionchus fissidentatus]
GYQAPPPGSGQGYQDQSGHYSQSQQQPPTSAFAAQPQAPGQPSHAQGHYAQPYYSAPAPPPQQPNYGTSAPPPQQPNYGTSAPPPQQHQINYSTPAPPLQQPHYSAPTPPSQQQHWEPETTAHYAQPRHYRNPAPPPAQQQHYREEEYSREADYDRQKPKKIPVDSSPIDFMDEELVRYYANGGPSDSPFRPISASGGRHTEPEQRRTGAFRPVQQLQQPPLRPDPIYAAPRQQREGGEERHYMENPLFDGGGERHPPRGRPRRDQLTVEEEEEQYRLSLLNLPRSLSPETSSDKRRREDMRMESDLERMKLNDSYRDVPSHPRRSSSPDYWAMANGAPFGSIEGLRQNILTLLNSYAMTCDSKEPKLVTIEFLIKVMNSFEVGDELKRHPDRADSLIKVFGFNKKEITWMNFLRAMRDDGLLKIHQVNTHQRDGATFALYAPHAKVWDKFVDPQPYTR